ncbi:choice-of-anchor I family protein [Hydrogenophaga sp. BPS33]|uniref:choice-of-anchor I family protein n=1 Tax=Hydrogenophaga sp. BPS33 TaxID=2651974 RepID=UPI0013205433|nr:choice-of-anchor I family protein [Hydrogenophaga sp. BPS33]QHE85376.1 alkaline phosphatase [Hydrogenophaga sp. BPS33]
MRSLSARIASPRLLTVSLIMSAVLAACGGGGGGTATPAPGPVAEATPAGLTLEKIGSYSTGQYEASAAEIPAFDAASKRLFMVNAQLGAVDVLDMRNPANPTKIDAIDATTVLAGASINSVAVHNGIVAVAIQAAVKTDPGRMALYRASDLTLLGSVAVGALPDMVTFTPDGQTVLVANEGEPSDNYQTDPEGSISIIDVRNPAAPVERKATFTAFNGQEATLRAAGVRIYGPGATVAKDLEPEYIAVSADGATAWVTLQENNALAKVDIASATVTDVLPLGYKDHGVAGNEFDASDRDNAIRIKTWAGVHGMYLPDAMASYSSGGQTYLVTANEGDARAWGEGNAAYLGTQDPTLGFIEELRVSALAAAGGWGTVPPQLRSVAGAPNLAGALLDPTVFGYCGALAGGIPGTCIANGELGRLNISWTQGYKTDAFGAPLRFTSAGVQDVNGDRLMYEKLYSYGARSFSIWNANGGLVWDSGAEIEKFLASADCKLGSARNMPCADYFNSGHDEGDALDSRSDAKGPEPEGIALGQIGSKTFAFIGLERMGGVLVYDITNPTAPTRVDYLNTRDEWVADPDPANLATVGDLGPEGLVFIPASRSPNGKPLLVVGNEVSGTTSVMQLNLRY